MFGSHDSWLREIRQKLPAVRFVDREASPNADLIRNADVIRIQANSLTHKHYYKIIDIVQISPERCDDFASGGVRISV